MSAEASGYVYRHSPYQGITLLVHLAVADSVNDQHGNEFWMAQGKLAEKARCSRKAANEALATLLADGFLEVVQQSLGRPSRYRFLFPNPRVVYDTRGVSPEVTGSPKVSPGVTPPSRNLSPGVTGVSPEVTQNPKEPKKAFEPKNSKAFRDVPKPDSKANPPDSVARLPVWSDERRRFLEAIPTVEQATPKIRGGVPPQLAQLREALRKTSEGLSIPG
jgi:hypothetical protein